MNILIAKEEPEFELKRLRKELYKSLQEEVFGGLSSAERAEHDRKANRIHELEKGNSGQRSG
jgi:hypothetical protein